MSSVDCEETNIIGAINVSTVTLQIHPYGRVNNLSIAIFHMVICIYVYVHVCT